MQERNADAIWKLMPKTVPEAVAAMRDWEHKYGPPDKVWFKKGGYVEKKMEVLHGRMTLDQLQLKLEPR